MSKTKNSHADPFDKENEVKLAREAEWVQRASHGDQDAFDKLYETHIDYIYNYFFSRIRNKSIAEMLTSQTFTEAAWALVQGHYNLRVKPFKLWIYSIANSVLREHHHKSPKMPPQEGQDVLWQIIRELPPAEQQILGMRHLDHLSSAEIAILLGCSEEDSKRLYDQALIKLKHLTQKRGL